MNISAVIVAGGSGVRFGSDKMLADVGGMPLIKQTVSVFIKNERIKQIIVVASKENRNAVAEIFEKENKVFVTIGGETRSCSVVEGLRLVSRSCDIVLIHDGARPYVTQQLVDKLIDEAENFGNAIPYVSATDTMYLASDGGRPIVLNRDNAVCVQTPQAFDYRSIMTAYSASSGEFSDDSRVYLNEYGKLHFVEGEITNKKITYAVDLVRTRIGCGADVHRFQEGRDLMLGGVRIPYPLGLLGHSDADVLMHAVCDALLSAIDERDIGVQFPDTDIRYKGISGAALLYKVGKMLSEKRASVINVTAVIICEKPKLMEYIPKMASNIASVLHINDNCVNLSATTTEKLGMLGQGDGIAAQAYALVQRAE